MSQGEWNRVVKPDGKNLDGKTRLDEPEWMNLGEWNRVGWRQVGRKGAMSGG